MEEREGSWRWGELEMRSKVWEAAAGRGVEVEKIREKKRCEEKIVCKQVDVGVVQRLAGYLFIRLEVCLLICVCVCVCSNYIFQHGL